MTETQQLLAKFVKDGSEAAFRELVSRYLDLVYSTALRLVDGDTHRAKDVSQVVFADLARMAARLSGSTTLGGWLHRHTCFVARTMMRGERRRQARERQAADMNTLNEQGQSLLAQVAPVLDEAIQELGADDRDAILLRFFERRNLRSVGEALGTTENVAQKRVARAVQELGILLRRRGVVLPAAALASALAAGAVKAAPAGLATSLAGAVLAGVGTAASPGLSSAQVALLTKIKAGLVGGIIVATVITAIFIHNQTRPGLADNTPVARQLPEQGESSDPEAIDLPLPPTSFPKGAVREARVKTSQPLQPATQPVEPTIPKRAAPVVNPAANPPVLPLQRLAAGPGNRVRIEGTSSVHDWQAEGSVIGGFLAVGPDFPAKPGQTFQPGPVQAEADVFIPVRSLASVDKDSRPFSGKMDELMYQSLREREHPRIRFHLADLSLRGATNVNGVRQYEFDARGELTIAGVTNEIDMPVWIVPLASGKVQASGGISIKMSSFDVSPPSPVLTAGVVTIADDVLLRFDWIVSPRQISSPQNESGMVPLVLDLPAAAFKGAPKDLQLGGSVEPLPNKPRPPMMVPARLKNLATDCKLWSSDTNCTSENLARIVDGDKSASDRSIIFLRKGTQWVQMDLGRRQEIFAVVIWHAHNAAKIYHDVIVRVADDADFVRNVRTVFNNDSDNTSGLGAGANREYIETHEGKLINARGVKARYIRFYSRGSTESALNEYTEIEVYGRPAR